MNKGRILMSITFAIVFFGAQKATCQDIDTLPSQDTLLKCIGGKIEVLHVFRSQEELQAFAKSNWSDHSACLIYELPLIDFNTFTLVLYTQLVGGCGQPDYWVNFYRDNGSKEVRMDFHYREHGNCRMAWTIYLQKLIPKTEGEITVSVTDHTFDNPLDLQETIRDKNSPTLLSVYDLQGHILSETKNLNGLYFYLYSDGSVKKVYHKLP